MSEKKSSSGTVAPIFEVPRARGSLFSASIVTLGLGSSDLCSSIREPCIDENNQKMYMKRC